MGQLQLQLDYFYSLTYRQFANTVSGFRKYEDAKSREQWVMTRKIMFACVRPHINGSLNEMELIEFPWEKDLKVKMFKEELSQMKEVEKISEEFFTKFDNVKASAVGKA